MNRRAFLILAGGLTAATVASCSPMSKLLGLPVEIQLGHQRFRGTLDGKVLISNGKDENFEMHTNFGPDIAILDLKTNALGTLIATLDFKGHSFELSLDPQSSFWRTV